VDLANTPVPRIPPPRALTRVLTPGTPANGLLRFGLWLLTGLVVAVAARNLLLGYPWLVDAIIPLRAGERWRQGLPPYLADSFAVGPGYGLPFLYPPAVLPVIGLLAALPPTVVLVAWFAVGAAAAVFSLRRLAVPTFAIPIVLLWPPFLEALLGANVQLLLFAAFTALFFGQQQQRGVAPVERDLAEDARTPVRPGLQAAVVLALKVTQAHPWAHLARHNIKAALLGAAVVASAVAPTLLLTGVEVWREWTAQLARASDSSWPLYGASFLRSFPREVAVAVVFATLAGAAFVPRRRAAAWVGLLAIVGSPSLRVFGLLFLLPAMVAIRREISLVAALLVATYTFEGWWLAVSLVALALGLSRRYPSLLESSQ